ncbi:hypothetical protein [Streptacidiphilus sp. MAP5-3]|uniref:hypothetical protein n=1 Tax=unclassified Streptacidiphilus TaxID=2643834 RepID=UPI003513FDD5
MADVAPQAVAWDPIEVSIQVRTGTPVRSALAEIRAILRDLGADRAPADRPLCFCGEPLRLPGPFRGTPDG